MPRRPLWRSWPHVAVAGGSLLLAAAMWTGAALHWSDWHDDLGRQVEAMRVATRLRDALEDSHRRAAGVAALLAQLQASDARLAGSGALERGLRNALTGPSGDFDGVQLLEAGGRRLLAVGQPVGVPDGALRALPLPGLLWHQDQLLLAGRVPATDGQAERLYVGTLRPVTLADALRGEPSFVALRLNGGALVAILGTRAHLLEHGAPLPDADAATPSPQGATRHRISAPLPFGDAELVLESGSDAWLRHNVLWSGAALAAAQLAATLLLLGWLTRRLRHIEAHHAQDAARARDCAMRRITELLGALPAVLFRAETLPDRSLRLTSVSDNAGRITGLGWPDIAQPGAWRERVHPEDRAALARHRERLHRDGASSAEYRIRHGDGRTLWLREQAQVVPAGRPGGTEVMGYLADITAERRLQEQAMAGAKLATLGRMAASLAHELTQPIGVMMLAAENGLDAHAAEGAAAAPAMAAKLGRILQQTRRAQALVEHLRVFGRGDRGPVGPVDLAGAVEGALLLCAAVLQRGGVAAEVLVPPGLPPVAASPVLLEQVIVNLLLNAHDALQRVPEGRRGLSLRARAAPGGGVELRVADSGPGLPPEVMARLFEPFLTTKAPGQGMGLGLSICHGIIRSFGGEITGGNDGHGAVFTIRLPAHGAAPP